jgi:tetratricopeptide (TPR) repeat protein
MQKTSPFKFLNAYEKADRAIFFGRDREIEVLYEMAYQSNLTLVYGRSGTGKTSLLQCGLASRFATSDWLDISIRRRDNINESLLEALSKHAHAREENARSTLRDRLRKRRKPAAKADTGQRDSDGQSAVVAVLNDLYTQFFKPVYLIFDQFEELFILGQEDERQQFYKTISEIVRECGYCHIVFVLREESIAQLYDFESVLPSLFDKRLRVEPLNRASAIDVVVKTTAKFDIDLEDETIAERIIEAITSGKGQAELTYLQVFLDALYQAADPENPVFTHALVEKLGGIEDVLANFLQEQSTKIQTDLEGKYPGVGPRSVRNVLSSFVTLEGTKQPMVLAQVNIPNLSDEQVEFCVESLENSRILSFNDDRYELRHDTLAARIAASRSTADIAFLEVLKLIKDREGSFQSTNTYLSTREISFVQPFLRRIQAEGGLSSEQQKYISDSIRDDKRKRLKRTRQTAFAGILLTLGLIASVTLWLRAKQATYDQFVQAGDSYVDRSEFEAAIDAYERAIHAKRFSQKAESKLDTALQMQIVHTQFNDLIDAADHLTLVDTNRTYLANCDSLIKARELYTNALELKLSSDARSEARNKRQAVQNSLQFIFGELRRRADVMKDVQRPVGYNRALALYQQAQKVYPDDQLIQDKIDECLQNLE